MFMPSGRVWNEMKYEPSGFWPVPINTGDEFAFLAKVPTHVIKAVYRSCALSLSVTTAPTPAGTVLSTVLCIADDPASPFGITGVHRHPEEQRALDQIMENGRALFIFFDELSRPVLRAYCTLDDTARLVAKSLLEQTGERYSGSWTAMLGEVLDEVQALVDLTCSAKTTYNPQHVSVPLTLADFQTIDITAVGEHEARTFRLEDRDEGYVFEHGAWHLLEHLFAGTIFHSPQVTEGAETRELTDIFAYCDDVGHCYFETKAVGVLEANPTRSTQRRALNIERQIDTALSQLPGAMKRVQLGLPLTTKAGVPIQVPATAKPFRHGIVIVSELLPVLDWKRITAELLSSSNGHTMFHVLDLQELRLLVGVSKNNPVLFMGHLLYRHEKMRECGNALMRTKLDGPPLP